MGATAAPPKDDVKNDKDGAAKDNAGASGQAKTEPDSPPKPVEEKVQEPTAYVVLALGGPEDPDSELGFLPLRLDDSEEYLGDVVKAASEDEAEPGQGPSIFRAKSGPDARKQAAASFKGLAAWLQESEDNSLILAAVPASSWKPTKVVVVRAEPTLKA